MSDHQEKDHKHRKSANSKSQQIKHHHQNQGRHHRPKLHHQSNDNDGYDTHSTVEDNIFSDHPPDHQRHRDEDKTPLPHHCHQKKNHRHVSLSETRHSSSTGSSSSSSSPSSSSPSSSSSSSLSTPSSSSSSSSSSPSSSSSSSSSSPSSSSSSSSSSSTSSSSLSSETSSKGSDRRPLKKPQHSQSCTDISRKHKYFEEEDNDTAPLIERRGRRNSRSAKQQKGKSSHNGSAHGTLKNTPKTKRGSRNEGSFRKAKSMEALSGPKERGWHGNEDEIEQERRKGEARQNLMKEKKKFSAFLNEITRQVLSPMRLTTLGVTDAQRTCSPGPVSVRAPKGETRGETQRQQRSRHGSADSVRSRRSSCRSASQSLRHRSSDSDRRPDRSSLKRCDSRSQTSQSASCEHNHHHHGDHHSPHHKDHHYGDHHHGDHHHKNHCHHSGDHHHGDHNHGDHHHGDHRSPNHQHGEHQHHGNHHRPSLHHHHGDHQGHAQKHQHGNQITTDHHKGHHTPTHHHGDHHSSGHLHHHGDHHSEAHLHHHGDKHSPDHKHHHGDHHSEAHLHHHGDKNSPDHKHHHGDHHSPDHKHHHGEHHSEAHLHHHGDHHSEAHLHHHGDKNSPDHKHHHGDHHSPDHKHHHGEHHSEAHLHHHGDHHSEAHLHHHGDKNGPGHQHHHGDHHSEAHLHHHGDKHSPGHQHHHGDHHSSDHKHHHGDHHSPGHQHHHGDHQHHHDDHHSSGHLHHHGDHHQHHHGDHQHHPGNHHSETHQHHHGDHHSPGHQHHHGDHHRPGHQHHHGDHQHHHGDYYSKGRHQGHPPESHSNEPPSKNTDLDPDTHIKRRSSGGPPAHHGKKESPSNTSNTSSTSSPSSPDEEQTSFTGPSLHKEKAHELGRIMDLQGQNEGLHHSLLKTAVRMECLGEEFISSQKLLEAELQRTRIELSSLTEKFKRLHDNCSSTQQTNNLLEQKLHSVAQSMEGERERLNQRISALTEQIADAKCANSEETFSVTSVLNKTESDGAVNQMVPPIPPPPAQFMDSHNNYEKAKAGGQDQSLGPVPEEEESDWSEKGDETPRFILTGSNRGPVWRHQEADVDKDSESGGEEIARQHSPCPVQGPHLQFTIHNENLFGGLTGEGTYRITTSPNLGSAILIRSASLEEIPLARHHMQKELRGTEAMMDLHHQGHEAIEDLDNEIIHHWRSSSDRPIESRTSETESGLAGLESAERMLSQFIRGSQPAEGRGRGRTGGIPDELLKGERTQL